MGFFPFPTISMVGVENKSSWNHWQILRAAPHLFLPSPIHLLFISYKHVAESLYPKSPVSSNSVPKQAEEFLFMK